MNLKGEEEEEMSLARKTIQAQRRFPLWPLGGATDAR